MFTQKIIDNYKEKLNIRLKELLLEKQTKPNPIMERQMGLGLVNVFVCGMTNSGKSTLINALLGEILVPERSHTATNMVTYIGYNSTLESGVHLYRKKDNSFRHSMLDGKSFRQEYVYSLEEAVNANKIESSPIQAHINIDFPNKGYGIVYVDTLGTGANTHDTSKTIEHIGLADIFLYVIDTPQNYQLVSEDLKFIKQNIFTEKGNTVDPKNFFIVLNKCDPANGFAVKAVNNVKDQLKLFFSPDKSEYGDLTNNIFCVSSICARLALAGKYDFSEIIEYSPEIIEELTNNENKVVKMNVDLLKDSGIATLSQSVISRVFQITTDINNFIEIKAHKLAELNDPNGMQIKDVDKKEFTSIIRYITPRKKTIFEEHPDINFRPSSERYPKSHVKGRNKAMVFGLIIVGIVIMSVFFNLIPYSIISELYIDEYLLYLIPFGILIVWLLFVQLIYKLAEPKISTRTFDYFEDLVGEKKQWVYCRIAKNGKFGIMGRYDYTSFFTKRRYEKVILKPTYDSIKPFDGIKFETKICDDIKYFDYQGNELI